jgi:hypothetical protein
MQGGESDSDRPRVAMQQGRGLRTGQCMDKTIWQ